LKTTAPPEHILEVLNRLASEGHDVFLAGGCVRDAIMRRPINDWDMATSAMPVDVARLFPKTVLTGERFGTVTVLTPECQVEVTTFRTDGGYSNGRHPEQVAFASNITEDLGRRDFTINAIAESVSGELVDPYGGLEDIQKGIIKCVGGPNTRFSEDALRMFRALRFSAQLGFSIEHETMKAIYANVAMARNISSERIRIELEKTLLSNRPEISGEMIKIGLLDRFMLLSGKSPAGLAGIDELPKEQLLRWCAFCAVLLDEGYIKSAAGLLHDLHLDGKTIKTCLRALSLPGFPADRLSIKRLISSCGAEAARCAAAVSDLFGEASSLEAVEEILTSKECVTLYDLAIAGSDLIEHGHAPGRELGETLSRLLEHVLKHPQDNTRKTLLELATL